MVLYNLIILMFSLKGIVEFESERLRQMLHGTLAAGPASVSRIQHGQFDQTVGFPPQCPVIHPSSGWLIKWIRFKQNMNIII